MYNDELMKYIIINRLNEIKGIWNKLILFFKFDFKIIIVCVIKCIIFIDKW